MTERLGRADLHVHTVASDGTASVPEILDRAEALGDLQVVAITDHERIDAALAARELAVRQGRPFEIVVGEEVTTLGGHLLALFIEERIPPLRSMRATMARIHAQGGIAVPAHPLALLPMSASARTLRRLLADPDAAVHPDGLETWNATTAGRAGHARAVEFAAAYGLARTGGSDAHLLEQLGSAWTAFPGRTAADLRAALEAGRTTAHGSFHGTWAQARMVGLQYRKYAVDVGHELRGRLLRTGMGRDLGYPGGRLRPPRFEPPEPPPAADLDRGRPAAVDREARGDPAGGPAR